jgi:hypothetical protein
MPYSVVHGAGWDGNWHLGQRGGADGGCEHPHNQGIRHNLSRSQQDGPIARYGQLRHRNQRALRRGASAARLWEAHFSFPPTEPPTNRGTPQDSSAVAPASTAMSNGLQIRRK